ncbi:hypothetical protein Gpo141_00010964 [Globisporangium polare]
MSSSKTAIPQTPQEAATPSSAPFVVHVDASDYATNPAPQRIPADADAAAVMKKAGADGAEGNGDSAWEVDLVGCVDHCGDACCAWCLPCMSAGDAFMRIGNSGALIALILSVLYAATITLLIIFSVGGKDEVYTETERVGYHYYDVTYYIPHDRQICFLLSALACVSAYCLIVGKVRNVVRHFYKIPGSCGKDVAAGFFCTCCTLAQVNIHTRLAEKKKAEHAATLPAYTAA